MKVFSNKILFLRIIKNIPQIMDIQRHSSVLGDTVEKLSDEASYKQLFHAYRDEEALPSGEVLKEIIIYAVRSCSPVIMGMPVSVTDDPFSYGRKC